MPSNPPSCVLFRPTPTTQNFPTSVCKLCDTPNQQPADGDGPDRGASAAVPGTATVSQTHTAIMEKAKTERIKQLLSSYYGGGAVPGCSDLPAGHQQRPRSPAESTSGLIMQQQQPSVDISTGLGAAAAARPSAGSTISLDSPAFNPERHIAHMIQTYSIDRLMAEHKGMAKEIKNLDSDMQQLVYENYNKFISATDTIRSMKSNVDSMETDIDQLRSNMGEQRRSAYGYPLFITTPCHTAAAWAAR